MTVTLSKLRLGGLAFRRKADAGADRVTVAEGWSRR